MHSNSTSKATVSQYGLPWKVIFSMGVWHLWLHRNIITFRKRIIDESFHIQCLKKAAEFFAIAMEGRNKSDKQHQAVSWHKPPLGWVKLNTDESSLGNPGQVGCGGLLRNENGEWIKAALINNLTADHLLLQLQVSVCR
nr:putative ribonuclease h protein [Quercus suber]